MKRRIGAVAATLGLIAAGCGGGGGSTMEEAPLTKAQFIKQGDEICLRVGRRVGAAFAAEHGQKKAGTPKGEREELTALSLPAFRKELDEYRQLVPPQGARKMYDEVIASLKAGVEYMEVHPDKPLSTDPSGPFYPANQAWYKYGFHVCGR